MRSRQDDAGRAAEPGEPADNAGTSALDRRRRILIAVAVSAVVLSGAGIAASTMVKSPAQAAADAGPPERDVLTAPVERRVLKESVIVRGQVLAAQSVTVSPSGGGPEGTKSVVTKLPVKVGEKVKAGRVVAEVSGRPVFVLKGALPVYRDLKPGAKGDDVRQLQVALADVGFGSGTDASGEFSSGTQAALAAYYGSIGYDPRPVSENGAAQVQSAVKAVTRATRALQDTKSGDSRDTTTVDRAQEDLATAKEQLAEAQQQAGAMLPISEVVFLGSFPARVESVPVQVGSPVTSKVLTLSSGALAVRGDLSPSQKNLVRTGQKVRILSEVTGEELDGMVASVADGTTSTGGDGDGEGSGGADGGSEDGAVGITYTMTVKPDAAIPAELAGQDVRLTVEAASSKRKVLTVPYSAVSAAADGTTVVTVLERDGERRRVEVRTGLSGDGSVQVSPVGRAELAVGVKVIVGTKRAAAAAGEGTP
ncbi:peptidoglycan-binding domain-containing protein [Streptomyces sp. NPDC005134]|uniref:peptidoglycan-binding domain-containing protein n=1 Tax=Streptomyces sp. NPDC005098 TaxID=3154560 RepID=UPI0033AC9E59